MSGNHMIHIFLSPPATSPRYIQTRSHKSVRNRFNWHSRKYQWNTLAIILQYSSTLAHAIDQFEYIDQLYITIFQEKVANHQNKINSTTKTIHFTKKRYIVGFFMIIIMKMAILNESFLLVWTSEVFLLGLDRSTHQRFSVKKRCS